MNARALQNIRLRGTRRILIAATAAVMLCGADAAHGELTHRYSFTGDVNDSVGTANGTIVGDADFTTLPGQLIFNGTNTFVRLPEVLPTAVGSSVSIEIWGTYAPEPPNRNWERIFDFGANTTNNFFLTPHSGATDTRLRLKTTEPPNNEDGPIIAGTLNDGTERYLVAVLDGVNRTLSLYVDGSLAGTDNLVNINLDLSKLIQTNNLLGESQYGADAFLMGSLNEFRIYDHVVTPYRQAINMALGPNNFTLPVNTLTASGASNWENAGSWSDGVPTAGQIAHIGNGGTVTISSDAGTVGVTRIADGTITLGAGGALLTGLEFATGGGPGSATVNINGGTLALGEVVSDGGAAAKALNFDGGTLRAEGDLPFPAELTTTINADGATINTQDFNVALSGNLVSGGGSGALTKQGAGTLRILGDATGFNGNINISEGRLITHTNLGSPTTTIQLGDPSGTAGGLAGLLTGAAATVASPLMVGSDASANESYLIGGAADANSIFSGPITLKKSLTISQANTTGTNELHITGGIVGDSAGNALTLTFAGAGEITVENTGISENAGTTIAVVKDNGGRTTFLADNAYTGGTTINGGVLLFSTPGTMSGTGPNILINAGGVAGIGPTFTNLQSTVLMRIDPTSAGTLAISASTAEDLNFDALALATLGLGAIADATYTGTITPAGGAYRLGGGGAVLTLPNTNAVTGDNALIVSGPGGGGVVVLSGASNNYTGSTTITGNGILQVNSTDQLGSGADMIIDNGTLRVTGDQPFVLSKNLSVGGAVLDVQNPAGVTIAAPVTAIDNGAFQKQGTGPLTIAADMTLAGAPTWFRNGITTVGTGGSVTTTGFMSVGLNPDLPLDDNGTLIVQGTGRVTANGDFNVGDVNVRGVVFIRDEAVVQAQGLWLGKFGPTAEGVVVQTGGMLEKVGTGTPEWQIGGNNSPTGLGSYWITNGTFNTGASNFQIGAAGKGIMTVNGGSVTSGGWTALGRFGAASAGVLDITAGTFTHANSGTRFIVAEQGQGTVNMRGGELIINSGNVNDAMDMGIAASANATVNLLGGTITTLSVGEANNTNAATSVFNFNGGTLRAAGSTDTFMQGLDHAYVHAGGAIIDTNANDITIGQDLESPAGDGVTVIPLADGGSGYIAPPLVITDETGSGGAGARAVATINPTTGQVTSLIVTNPGVGYTTPPTFTIVGGGGTGATAGTAALGANNTSGGLTKNGEGTLTLTGNNTYTGATIVNAGALVTRFVRGGALAIAANASATFSPDGGTSDVSSLTIAGTTDAWTGKLDITNNDLVIRTPGGAARDADYATALNQVKSGLNAAGGVFWTGNGIQSSAAAAESGGILTAVGIILNDFAQVPGLPAGPIMTEFSGRTVSENDILLKYTWFGDADLSGVVDATDYSLIDNAFNLGLVNGGWLNGDFDFNGLVDATDYSLIDNAFNSQTGPLTGSAASAVPEPSTLAIAALAGGMLMSRRRRRTEKAG